MKAVTWQGKRDVRVEEVPDPRIEQPTDAVIRVTSTNICGSDLHLYEVLTAFMEPGDILGHEAMGVVEEVGGEITSIKRGDRVVIPFQMSCGDCFMCGEGLYSQCETTQVREYGSGAALFGYSKLYGEVPGGQAEYLRVPQAQFTSIPVPEGLPDERFVYLSDVLPTAWQAVEYAGVPKGGTVAVLGLGPIGDMSSRIAMHHGARVIGVDMVPERIGRAASRGVETLDLTEHGDDLGEVVRDLTGGRGPDSVIDAVGMEAHGSWGVDTIFGLPGDGINGFMEALRTRHDQIKYIHVRHEEVAAMAAVGYAKFTGKLGVCFSTAGPGAAHLLNGLLDARVEQAPILAITGMSYHDLIGTSYLQDVNTDYMFNDVALYNQRIMGPAHVTNVIDYAVRTALTQRGPAHIAFPIDFQAAPADSGMRFDRNVQGHTSTSYRPPIQVPQRQDMDAAAAVLGGKAKVAILAGAGARGAGPELEAVAEKLGAPIIKAQLGKDCVPDDSPYTTGPIALVGSRPSEEALEQCDALLIVGSTMPYIEYYPSPGQAVCVQIDDKPERMGLRYPVDVPLCGDARATLSALLPLLARNEDRAFLQQAQDGMREWWALMDERGTSTDVPMKPQVPARAVSEALASDAIVCGDSGTVTTWSARQIKVRRGQSYSFSGTNCSMAAGLPYAIGAQAAFPDRQVVVFTGDGSLTMQLGDFLTAVQHHLPIKLVVIKNNTLGLIKWEQMVFLGNPEFGVNFAPLDFVKFAEACGARGVHIDDPTKCADQMREALSSDGPVIIECVVDPHEPPMPAKVKTKQVKKLAQALREGTPNRNRIALQMVKDVLDESSFEASPGGFIPDKLGHAVAGVARKLRDRADPDHPE